VERAQSIPFHAGAGPYDIVLCDIPWMYFGDANKNAAAGKHYRLMETEQVHALPVREIMSKRSVVFLWATGPKLDAAIDVIRAWDLHYRGVSYVWVKTRKDGTPIGAQGVMPTFTKPTTEFVLAATTNKRGRPFPILDLKQPQVVFAPRGRHSEKPPQVRERIESLCGERPRIELFARGRVPGWDVWGDEAIAE
jgi:N6-adenosine-specific RNA methylase IME4